MSTHIDPFITAGQEPQLKIPTIGSARSAPPVRGEALLRMADRVWIRLSGAVSRAFPDEFNPFAQLGAVANTMFMVALVTGILLLFWYSPSVVSAYDSVAGMSSSPFLAELIRSLHRYSSDVCLLFIVLHAFQMLGARKFGGSRWVAWISGMVLLGLVWMDGWTGYWLVWDERARQIALGTARFLDVLPIFPDPLLRSFLTNEGLNSLLFFIIFFIHMLIPIGMALFLWIHIMRTNAAKFFTSVKMSAALFVVLVITSLLFPATIAAKADMMSIPTNMNVDWLFMMPIWFTDRLSGGILWVILFFTTIGLWGIPWWLTRGRPVSASVNPDSCNGCTQCIQDCPFNAIDLIPSESNRGENREVALVNADKCVGCGICVGSCDSSSITQFTLPVMDVRRFVSTLEGDTRHVAFICAESAGERFAISEDGSCGELPGYKVVPVPCVGWVHMLTVERALRRGAAGVLIAGCGIDPACRLGAEYTEMRLNGTREPWLRTDHVDPSKVHFSRIDKTNPDALIREAAGFLGRDLTSKNRFSLKQKGSVARKVAVAVFSVVVLLGFTVFLSDSPYSNLEREGSTFIVSLKHVGEVVASTSAESNVDDSNVLPHMRRERPVERIRVPVQIRISVDDTIRALDSFKPGGLFNDGLSIGMTQVALSPGRHEVSVEMNGSADPTNWHASWKQSLVFYPKQSKVLVIDEDGRFHLYQQ